MYPSKTSTLIPCFVVALAAGSLLACGGEEESAPVGAKGFTACGSFPDFQPKTCQPGQDCAHDRSLPRNAAATGTRANFWKAAESASAAPQ